MAVTQHQITVWRAEDGTEFRTQAEAEYYEVESEMVSELEEFEVDRTPRVNAVRLLLDNPSAWGKLRAQMQKHGRI